MIYRYHWGNNPTRARLKGRKCIILSVGKMGSVLVEFLDDLYKVITSRRALRKLNENNRNRSRSG